MSKHVLNWRASSEAVRGWAEIELIRWATVRPQEKIGGRLWPATFMHKIIMLDAHAHTNSHAIRAKTNSPNCIKLLPSKNRSIHCWEVWVKNTIRTHLAFWCYLVLAVEKKKEAHSSQEKTATCVWKCDWNWQCSFLSVFEEQLLTFTTKSSNMLSTTSGLWAWQSLGFSVIMEIFVDVSAWKKPRGAFTRPTIKPFCPLGFHPCAEFSSYCGFVVVSQPVTPPINHLEQNRGIISVHTTTGMLLFKKNISLSPKIRKHKHGEW